MAVMGNYWDAAGVLVGDDSVTFQPVSPQVTAPPVPTPAADDLAEWPWFAAIAIRLSRRLHRPV